MGGKIHTGEHENFGRHNIGKHREIKDGEKYITLEISLKLGSMDKIKVKSSEPKYYLVLSRKGLIDSLGLKNHCKVKEKQKGKVCH